MLRSLPSVPCGFRWPILGSLLLVVLGWSLGTACAQSTGIAAERMMFHSGPSAFYQVEGGEVAAPRELWLHSAASLLSNPLRLRQRYTGELLATPVSYRVTLDLGGELGLWKKRLSLGVGLPVALWQNGDRLQATGGNDVSIDRPLRSSAVGDIRLRAKVRLTPTDWFWSVDVYKRQSPVRASLDRSQRRGSDARPGLGSSRQGPRQDPRTPHRALENDHSIPAPLRAFWPIETAHPWACGSAVAHPEKYSGMEWSFSKMCIRDRHKRAATNEIS